MPDEIQGAENIATVPPTDSTQQQTPAEEMFQNAFGDVVDVNATDNANASQVVTEKAEDTAQTENADVDTTDADETPEQKAEREKFIPRDRFDQVNAKAQTLEQELAQERERNTKREQEWQEQQGEIAIYNRARAAGVSVEEFKQAQAWAEANNYGTAENVLRATNELSQYEAEQNARVAMDEISESVRDQLVESKRIALSAQAISNASAQALQEIRRTQASYETTRNLDTALATASADLRAAGVDANAITEFEKTVRKVGHPQAIADFAPILKLTASAAGKNAVIANNERRAANGNGAPPAEGRGGGTPPVQVPKMSAQQAKGTLISDLLGMRKNYG